MNAKQILDEIESLDHLIYTALKNIIEFPNDFSLLIVLKQFRDIREKRIFQLLKE